MPADQLDMMLAVSAQTNHFDLCDCIQGNLSFHIGTLLILRGGGEGGGKMDEGGGNGEERRGKWGEGKGGNGGRRRGKWGGRRGKMRGETNNVQIIGKTKLGRAGQ